MNGCDPSPAPVLDISPEPSPDELAAISVVILALADAVRPPSTPAPDPPGSAWRTAALREGVSGIAGGSRSGWGRPQPEWRG